MVEAHNQQANLGSKLQAAITRGNSASRGDSQHREIPENTNEGRAMPSDMSSERSLAPHRSTAPERTKSGYHESGPNVQRRRQSSETEYQYVERSQVIPEDYQPHRSRGHYGRSAPTEQVAAAQRDGPQMRPQRSGNSPAAGPPQRPPPAALLRTPPTAPPPGQRAPPYSMDEENTGQRYQARPPPNKGND